MKKQWGVRKAVPKDSVELHKCMELAYASYEERLGGIRLPPMDVDYDNEIRNFPTWVAVFSGRVVGGLIMVYETEYASIANIAVHPAFQGQGIGRGLMNFAENEAKDKGYSELRLATHVLLTENVSAYLHSGWSEIERDEVRVYMKKHI